MIKINASRKQYRVYTICMECMGVCRFFAWLSEIVAWRVLHLDLKVDTIGLFAANGIEIKTNHGIKIVSWYGHMVIIKIVMIVVNFYYVFWFNPCGCQHNIIRPFILHPFFFSDFRWWKKFVFTASGPCLTQSKITLDQLLDLFLFKCK